MVKFRIKATILRKDDKQRNVESFADVLNVVYANEQIVQVFKDKYNEWSQKFSSERKRCNSVKSGTVERLKLSRFTRIIIVAIISFCVLQNCTSYNMSYLLLGLSLYLSIVSMNLASSAVISYFGKPNNYISQVNQYFENVCAVYQCFKLRLNAVRRKFNLNINLSSDVHVDTEFGIRVEHNRNLFYSVISMYNIHGVLIGFVMFTLCHYFQYEIFVFLEVFSLYLMIFIAVVRDVKIISFIIEMKNRRKVMKSLTVDFLFWFENKCEIKNILQNYEIIDNDTDFFPVKMAEISGKIKYLNLAIFTVSCQEVQRLNLSKHNLEHVIAFLLYGQHSSLNKIIFKTVDSEVIQLSNEQNPGGDSLMTSNSSVLPPEIDCKKEFLASNQNISISGPPKIKSTTAKPLSKENSRVHTIDYKDKSTSTDANAKESRIPKYLAKTSNCSSSGNKRKENCKDTSQKTNFDETLQLRSELFNSKIEQKNELSNNVECPPDLEVNEKKSYCGTMSSENGELDHIEIYNVYDSTKLRHSLSNDEVTEQAVKDTSKFYSTEQNFSISKSTSEPKISHGSISNITLRKSGSSENLRTYQNRKENLENVTDETNGSRMNNQMINITQIGRYSNDTNIHTDDDNRNSLYDVNFCSSVDDYTNNLTDKLDGLDYDKQKFDVSKCISKNNSAVQSYSNVYREVFCNSRKKKTCTSSGDKVDEVSGLDKSKQVPCVIGSKDEYKHNDKNTINENSGNSIEKSALLSSIHNAFENKSDDLQGLDISKEITDVSPPCNVVKLCDENASGDRINDKTLEEIKYYSCSDDVLENAAPDQLSESSLKSGKSGTISNNELGTEATENNINNNVLPNIENYVGNSTQKNLAQKYAVVDSKERQHQRQSAFDRTHDTYAAKDNSSKPKDETNSYCEQIIGNSLSNRNEIGSNNPTAHPGSSLFHPLQRNDKIGVYSNVSIEDSLTSILEKITILDLDYSIDDELNAIKTNNERNINLTEAQSTDIHQPSKDVHVANTKEHRHKKTFLKKTTCTKGKRGKRSMAVSPKLLKNKTENLSENFNKISESTVQKKGIDGVDISGYVNLSSVNPNPLDEDTEFQKESTNKSQKNSHQHLQNYENCYLSSCDSNNNLNSRDRFVSETNQSALYDTQTVADVSKNTEKEHSLSKIANNVDEVVDGENMKQEFLNQNIREETGSFNGDLSVTNEKPNVTEPKSVEITCKTNSTSQNGTEKNTSTDDTSAKTVPQQKYLPKGTRITLKARRSKLNTSTNLKELNHVIPGTSSEKLHDVEDSFSLNTGDIISLNERKVALADRLPMKTEDNKSEVSSSTERSEHPNSNARTGPRIFPIKSQNNLENKAGLCATDDTAYVSAPNESKDKCVTQLDSKTFDDFTNPCTPLDCEQKCKAQLDGRTNLFTADDPKYMSTPIHHKEKCVTKQLFKNEEAELNQEKEINQDDQSPVFHSSAENEEPVVTNCTEHSHTRVKLHRLWKEENGKRFAIFPKYRNTVKRKICRLGKQLRTNGQPDFYHVSTADIKEEEVLLQTEELYLGQSTMEMNAYSDADDQEYYERIQKWAESVPTNEVSETLEISDIPSSEPKYVSDLQLNNDCIFNSDMSTEMTIEEFMRSADRLSDDLISTSNPAFWKDTNESEIPEEVLITSQTPPTGSSEDTNYHFHPSTSPSYSSSEYSEKPLRTSNGLPDSNCSTINQEESEAVNEKDNVYTSSDTRFSEDNDISSEADFKNVNKVEWKLASNENWKSYGQCDAATSDYNEISMESMGTSNELPDFKCPSEKQGNNVTSKSINEKYEVCSDSAIPFHEVGNVSNTMKCEASGGIKFSNDMIPSYEKHSHEQFDSVPTVYEGGIVNQHSNNEISRADPLKYHLKYENLDLYLSDSSPCITIRFIYEKDEGRPELTYKSQCLASSSFFPSISSIDEQELPLSKSSSFKGQTSEERIDISEGNFKMSVEKENINETQYSRHACQNLTSRIYSCENNEVYEKSDASISNSVQSGSESEVTSSSQTIVENQSGISSIDKSGKIVDERESGENKICEKDADDIRDEDWETSMKTNSSSETLPLNNGGVFDEPHSERRNSVTEAIDICDRDVEHFEEHENNLEAAQTSDLETQESSKDFHFEAKGVKLNYMPTVENNSVEIKFRKLQDKTKLTFKSAQKALYVKMSSDVSYQ